MIDKPGASPERIWWSAHHPSHRFAVGQLGHRQLLHPAHNCCWVSSMCKTCVTKMGFAQNRFILKLFNSRFGSCQWVSKSCSWGPGWSTWCAAGSASCNECGWLVIYPYKIVYIYSIFPRAPGYMRDGPNRVAMLKCLMRSYDDYIYIYIQGGAPQL